MKIALIQHDIVWENPTATRERVRPLLEQAAARGAELAVLPEMFAVGFSMEASRVAEPADGPTTAWLAETASSLGMAVIAGLPIVGTGADRPANHAVLVDAQGQVRARYAKVHPFSLAGEEAHYAAGRELVLAPLGGFTVGLAICYDLRFPELFRGLAHRGADLLVVIANWPAARVAHWSLLLRARAVENVAYVVGVNRTGAGGGLDYPGASVVVDPAGQVVVEGEAREAVLLADVDPGRVGEVRKRFPFLKDRRADLFGERFGDPAGD